MISLIQKVLSHRIGEGSTGAKHEPRVLDLKRGPIFEFQRDKLGQKASTAVPWDDELHESLPQFRWSVLRRFQERQGTADHHRNIGFGATEFREPDPRLRNSSCG